jgi:hypothetical protein
MPYTKPDRRDSLNALASRIAQDLDFLGNSKGDLNYVLSRIVTLYAVNRRHTDGKVSYDALSDARAALTDAGTEWDARVMRTYEDLKIEENGDVYDEILELIGS